MADTYFTKTVAGAGAAFELTEVTKTVLGVAGAQAHTRYTKSVLGVAFVNAFTHFTKSVVAVAVAAQQIDTTKSIAALAVPGDHYPVVLRSAGFTDTTVSAALFPASGTVYTEHRWQFADDPGFVSGSILEDVTLDPSITVRTLAGLTEGTTVYVRVISRTDAINGLVSNTVVITTGSPPLGNIFTAPEAHAFIDKATPFYVCWEHPDPAEVLPDATRLLVRSIFDSDSAAIELADASDLVGVNCFEVDLGSLPDGYYTFVLEILTDVYYHPGFALVGDAVGVSGCDASTEFRWASNDTQPASASDIAQWGKRTIGGPTTWRTGNPTSFNACSGGLTISESGDPDPPFQGLGLLSPPTDVVPQFNPTYYRIAGNAFIFADGIPKALGQAYQVISAEERRAGFAISGPWGSAIARINHGLLSDDPLGRCGIAFKGLGSGTFTLDVDVTGVLSQNETAAVEVVASMPPHYCRNVPPEVTDPTAIIFYPFILDPGRCWPYAIALEMVVDPSDPLQVTFRAAFNGIVHEIPVTLAEPIDCANGSAASQGVANFLGAEFGWRQFSDINITACGEEVTDCVPFDEPEPFCPTSAVVTWGGWRQSGEIAPPGPNPDPDPPDPSLSPDPPPSGDWPNEPIGYTVTVSMGDGESDPFTLPLINQAAGAWAYNEAFSSGVSVVAGNLRWTYPTGFEGGASPGRAVIAAASPEFANYYVGVRVRFNPGWTRHPNADKVLYGGELSANNLTAGQWYIGRVGDGAGSTVQANQSGSEVCPIPFSTARNFPCAFDGSGEPFEDWINETTIDDGQWHTIEGVMLGNTGGAANGYYALYVDGLKQWEYTNVRWGQAATARFHGINLDPVWGGGPGVFKPQEDWMEIGALRVSGSS